MTTTEEKLLNSPFLDAVRELRFDEAQYAALVELLEALAKEWAGKELVDKRVAAELQLLPTVVRSAAARLKGREIEERLLDATEELETLALSCLMPRMSRHSPPPPAPSFPP